MSSSTSAALRIDSARMMRNELTNTIHTNSGSRRMVRPGARMARMVTMKLMPAATEPMPVASRPSAQ